MITKVTLKNWRSHLESSLNFCDGTNCIIGSVGSGKTSIFDGICFALFGTFPMLQQKKLKLKDVVMRKPKLQTKAFSEVEFEINGNLYSVKRGIESGRTAVAELRRDKEVIEAQPQKVTEEVERILKVSYDLFTRAVYSEQNQLDMFLTIPKGQRMKKIDELLDLDKFEKARLSTLAIIKMCKNASSERNKVIGSLEVGTDLSEIELLKKDIKDIRGGLKTLEKDLEKTLQEKSAQEKKITSLEKVDSELKSASEDLSNALAVLSQTNEDITYIEEKIKNITPEKISERLKDVLSEISILEEAVKNSADNESSIKEKLYKIKAKLEYHSISKRELEKNIEQKESLEKSASKLKELEKFLEYKERNIENLEKERNLLNVRIGELEKSAKELKEAKDSCPICDIPLEKDKKHSILQKKLSETKELKKSLIVIEADLKMSQTEIEKTKDILEDSKEAEKKIKEIKKAESEIKVSEEQIRKLSAESNYLEEELEKLQNKISEDKYTLEKFQEDLRQIREKLSYVEEFSKKEKLKNSLKEKISKLSKRKSDLEDQLSMESLDSVRKSIQNLTISQKSIEVKIESSKDVEKEKSKRLSDLEIKRDIIEKHKEEIKKMEELSKQLTILEEAFKLTQEQLRKDFVSAVNQTMEEMWQKLYPYGDFYSVRLEVDNDYVLQLQDDTGWMSVDMVSGGERSIACLALRIAFALVLAPQLRWLVLDEPTHNLDAKSVEELSKVLREYIGEFVDQVFLITHDPSMENAVSGYLYRLERDKEKNGFTKVECIASN